MQDKQLQIIATAIRLFWEEGMSVPTAKIARESGVSNGTLFHYFATKQALIDSVYVSVKQCMAAMVLDPHDARDEVRGPLYAFWRRYFTWAQQHMEKHLVLGLLKSSHVLSATARNEADTLFQANYEALEKAVQADIIVALPLDYLCELIAGTLNTAVQYAHDRRLRGAALEQHIQESFGVLWNGIAR